MKILCKKITVLSILTASMVNSVPAPSHAIVGAVSGAVPLMAIGGAMIVGGWISMGGSCAVDDDGGSGTVAGLMGVGGLLTSLAGLIILDDHRQVSPHFTVPSAEQAKALEISDSELSALGEEIDQVNSIYQSIVSETMKFNTKKTTEKEIESFAEQRWQAYEQALNPEAQSAVTKIRAGFAAQLNQAASR